ncbi:MULTISPECIES: hypothetical protein [Metabacillus]|uniref:Uncharacterized protein n=1 Tax=Metabacillus hrfriensis TaxID=3048891 RepID=A0ACD4R710_9BACI|nr:MULTISPECIES: hypothetical protein [Metabacillus]UAL50767.1 hypothetical protein K8L98_16205 [Metabacillus dongyingensis]UOK56817.1 hypothetical protein MGI18_18825 [Bacillus sp. OVS6]USK27040.1 hypothetical protein LIT32_16300 [Bacillus sp. CMF21]WHZ56263.1 hypothetical protein QLQ22_16370 [Metabacillus sp. CT-WN-B3]
MQNEHMKRISAEPSDSPKLVIKTNLDSSTSAEENPYFSGSDKEKVKKYFEDR